MDKEISLEFKVCTKCKTFLHFSNFSIRKASKDGLSPICRKCRKIYADLHLLKNRETINYKRRTFYLNNSTKILERCRKWAKENRAKINIRTRKSRLKNPDKKKIQDAEYRKRNREKIRQRSSEWNKKHYPLINASTAKYRYKKFMAAPKWLTPEQWSQIEEFYSTAHEMTRIFGEKYSVDHVVPIQGTNVCGLHVPWNLRVIPLKQNISKGNR